jgi:branched-chain amino acid transport system ATP-binding protein
MVFFAGAGIGGSAPELIARAGISLVPEGRKLFPRLTVRENLEIGGNSGRKGHWTLQSVYELFPVLQERQDAMPNMLSGGQQQMVAIGRALMSNAKLLLFDEVSLGLAPVMIKDLYKVFPRIKQSGAAIILVEQNIQQALAVADRFYCFQKGRVSLEGTPGSASQNDIKTAYFGGI